MARLDNLFSPDSVAVIGATDREGSVGRSILQNLLKGYEGSVLPINPNRDEVMGERCYPSPADAPIADLGIVVVPAQAVIAAVRDAAEAGIQDVVVITAGFSETGSEGSQRERELVELAERHELNLVGPNCLGIMSTGSGLNASFGPQMPEPGQISFLSQSGAFITAVLDWAADHDIGFRDVVSLGNQAVMTQTNFVQSWGDDPETDVIVGYVEAIDDGREFIETARTVTAETPVILVKSGRTDAGARAASSHTGSMAGNERTYEAGLDQAGVLRAESVEELFDMAQALGTLPAPSGNSVAVVTNAGGPGVMATDAIGDSALSLATLSERTRQEYASILPPGASVQNPVDILGDADADRFGDAIEVALDDSAVDAVLVVAAPTAVLDFDTLANRMAAAEGLNEKPVAASLMGGSRAERAGDHLRTAGIITHFDPLRSVRSLDALARQRAITKRDPPAVRHFDFEESVIREHLERARDRPNNRLGVEAMPLLDACGISIPRGEVVDSAAAAESVAAELGGPVVMKLVSPDITHKTDIGGVEIGVDPKDVPDVYEAIVERGRQYQADATILGVQVQELVDLDDSTETIIGSSRDPQFGPTVLFGLGGIFVEALEDTTLRVAPVDPAEAEAMVDGIRAAPLLRGARGRPPADLEALAEAIERLSQLVTEFPAIVELDINPLLVGPDGVQALDLRLTVETDRL